VTNAAVHRRRSNERRDRVDAQEQDVTQPLLIEHDDGVHRVTLNRPEQLNALDPSGHCDGRPQSDPLQPLGRFQ
jgi:enoyl-CoA hydratase/carnithine racemase